MHKRMSPHGDFDHMGDSSYVINNINVDNVIFNCGEFNELELNLIKELDKKNINYYSCISELSLRDNIIYFLNNEDYNDENENSSVMYMKMNGVGLLFMGDAGTKREVDILNKYDIKDVDLFKVGHHGSNTSSSNDFIKSIKPSNCFISVGEKNRYGHPKREVLDTLSNYCNIYRTDIDGSIEVKLKNSEYKIKTINP